MTSLLRPQPPDLPPGGFARSRELEEWLRAVFIESSGALHVEAHEILQDAFVGALWVNEELTRKGKQVLATAEIPQPPQASNKWARARYWQQIDEWFPELEDGTGGRPDFIVTVWTGCSDLSDLRFCRVAHHELRHCAQAEKDGIPLFDKETGGPKWTIVGHDFEIFGSEIELFGIADDDWRSIELWSKQGNRVDDQGRCIHEVPPEPEWVHLAGRHYGAVNPGETKEAARKRWLAKVKR